MIFEDIVSEEITEKVVAARTAVAFKKLCFMIESSYLYTFTYYQYPELFGNIYFIIPSKRDIPLWAGVSSGRGCYR